MAPFHIVRPQNTNSDQLKIVAKTSAIHSNKVTHFERVNDEHVL